MQSKKSISLWAAECREKKGLDSFSLGGERAAGACALHGDTCRGRPAEPRTSSFGTYHVGRDTLKALSYTLFRIPTSS